MVSWPNRLGPSYPLVLVSSRSSPTRPKSFDFVERVGFGVLRPATGHGKLDFNSSATEENGGGERSKGNALALP